MSAHDSARGAARSLSAAARLYRRDGRGLTQIDTKFPRRYQPRATRRRSKVPGVRRARTDGKRPGSHTRRRRRPGHPGVARGIPAHARLSRERRVGQQGDGPAAGDGESGPDRAGHHDAGRGRPERLQAPAGNLAGADHPAHRADREHGPHRRPGARRGRLRRQAVRSARAGRAHQVRASPQPDAAAQAAARQRTGAIRSLALRLRAQGVARARTMSQ